MRDYHEQFGRRRGVWIPAPEVQPHIAMGWKIVDMPPNHDDVLMVPATIGEASAPAD